jgi:hypothetical protein
MARRMATTIFFAVLAGLVLVPGIASAQSAIVGVVRDTGGGVLPGVIVEVSSPALIEKVRTVISDDQGRYNVVDLRPGVYRVTFTLAGFSTLVRDAIELPANFTATIGAELEVGVLKETVTVSGDAPVVDVQSVQRTAVLPRDVLDAVPTGRTFAAAGSLAVGVKVSDQNVGGARTGGQQRLTTHGSTSADTQVEVDGISMNSWGDVQPNHNDAMWQEVTVQTSALGAETATGGVRVNLIPRDGGNAFSGAMFVGYTGESMQGDNLTQELRDRGLTAGDAVKLVFDVNTSLGGPVTRDRLWFFASFRDVGNRNYVANTFLPDGSPGVFDQTVLNYTARLTWQATPRNKFSIYKDRAFKSLDREFGSGVEPTKAAGGRTPVLYYTAAIKWASTVTNRLLVEGGWGASVQSRNGGRFQPGVKKERGTPEWFANASRMDLNRGTTTTASPGETYNVEQLYTWAGSATYATGSHTFKTGVQWRYGVNSSSGRIVNADLTQRYRDALADSVIVWNTPMFAREGMFRMDADAGIYAQDTWTLGRMTLSPGLRFYYLNSSIEPGAAPPGRFVPYRESAGIPDIADFTGVTPRFGIVYDLTGDARTALKGSVSKYYASLTNQYNRYNPLASQSDIRPWGDTNGDDIAQENEIGASTNSRFGLAPARRKDPDLKRPYNIEYSLAIDRQVFSGVSVTGAWFRRDNRDVERQDNLLISPSDWTPIQVANPVTGEPFTIYNLNRGKLGQSDLVDTTSTDSSVRGQTYTGFEASFNARIRGGATFFGGWWTDRTITVACDGDDPNTLNFCDQRKLDIPHQHNFKLAGSYRLPLDVDIAANLQSYAGGPLLVSWGPATSLFPGGRTTAVTVNTVIPPGTKYLKRWNQLDLGFKKVLLVRRTRVEAALDIFNLMNSSVTLAETQAFGSSLGQPTNILQPRLLRLSAQLKF